MVMYGECADSALLWMLRSSLNDYPPLTLSHSDIVREYRKLDDQVVTRLNRAQAQLRDEARVGKGGSPEGMCAKMWSEMMGASGGLKKLRG